LLTSRTPLLLPCPLLLPQDCGAVSLKRQRRFDRDHSRRSTVSHKPAQDAASSPAQPLNDLPWAASYLFSFVHQCLSNLGSLHDACRAIQEDTKAAKLACAIFRQDSHLAAACPPACAPP
jgi:hypothetical protein